MTPDIKNTISRNRLASIIIAACVVIMSAVCIHQCSTPAPFARAERLKSYGDTIDVAIEFGPTTLYIIPERSDSLGGFAYAMLQAIGGDSLVFKFHPVASTAEAIELLRKGSVDLVAAEIATITRQDSSLHFSPPVRLDRQVLVQRSDSDNTSRIGSVLDLAGKTVWVPADSPMLARLRNIESETGDSIDIMIDYEHGAEQLVILVAVGDIPYAVVNRSTAHTIGKDYPQLDIRENISFTQLQSWLMRSADTLLTSRIDSAIIRFTGSTDYETLKRQTGQE